jgi:hypothetical protein
MGAPGGAMGGMETGAEDMGAELGSMAPPTAGLPAEEPMPPAAEIGREKRESVDYSRRLGMLLASKKK